MNFIELSDSINPLINDINKKKDYRSAEKLINVLLSFMGIETYSKKLLSNKRVSAEISRFVEAPGFLKEAAAYDIETNKPDFIDLKLFNVKKSNKTTLSWLTSISSNFEDSDSLDYKNISIDFVIPDKKNALIILLSNKSKIRSLKLENRVTYTQFEIFTKWFGLREVNKISSDDKKNFHYLLWDSFNFEPINNQFYSEIVSHFKILNSHLEKIFDKIDAASFSTRLLGRLLFVWFLKKKGLIDESYNYFNGGDPKNQTKYYQEYLEKLFFEVLNKERKSRQHDDKNTPYLNGGLFDRVSDIFKNNNELTFPDNYFIDIFTTLRKYNFTTDEGSPEFQFVAVDPEMLGRIFESLLEKQVDILSKKSLKAKTGAHYTPREIVSYMCEESLINYLNENIDYHNNDEKELRIQEIVRMPESLFRDQDQNKRRDWKPFKEIILKKILGKDNKDAIKILDPAVGSGAFPIGMMQLIVKVITRLDYKYENQLSQLKKIILSRILHGVDINRTAIEICRLRAWLSIVVDEDVKGNIEPLPNLDFTFICANTLISIDEDPQMGLYDDRELKDNLIKIQKEYFYASHKSTKKKLQRQYNEVRNNTNLFENENSKLIKSYDPFHIQSVSKFYDSELHHGSKNFDIIIGNPPYLKERGNAEIFKPVNQSPLGKAYHQGKMDFWYYFLHFALNKITNKGNITFITSSYWLNAQGAKKLILRLRDESSFLSILNIGNLKVFHDVAGRHMISVISKIKKNKFNYLRIEDDLSMIQDFPIRFSEKSYKKIFINNEIMLEGDLGFKISSNKTINDEFEISQGETEGQQKVSAKNIEKLNLSEKDFEINEGVFVINNHEKNKIGFNKYEKKCLKKFIEPSNVDKWFYKIDEPKWIIYSDANIKKLIEHDDNFINLKKHLDRMSPFIKSDNGPYGLHRPRNYKYFKNPKILFKQMFKNPEFAIDYDGYVMPSNSHLIISKDNSKYSVEFLLGILNSSFAKIWFKKRAKKRGGENDVTVSKLRDFPIPDQPSKKIEDKVKLIQTEDQNNISILEKELDAYVFKAFKIDYQEILNFDNNFTFTKEEYDNLRMN